MTGRPNTPAIAVQSEDIGTSGVACMEACATAISFASAADAMMWAHTNRDASTAAAVFRVLDGPYRRRRITLEHARIVRIWCDLRRAPNPSVAAEAAHARLWHAVMEQLDRPLRARGIVR